MAGVRYRRALGLAGIGHGRRRRSTAGIVVRAGLVGVVVRRRRRRLGRAVIDLGVGVGRCADIGFIDDRVPGLAGRIGRGHGVPALAVSAARRHVGDADADLVIDVPGDRAHIAAEGATGLAAFAQGFQAVINVVVTAAGGQLDLGIERYDRYLRA